VGGREAILEFAEQYRASLPRYLETRGLTWEVNVWAQMEQDGWTPRWYKADHDDSLFSVAASETGESREDV
jgi:ribosomal protein S12 methylthiotransferase accessory factor YcaO